jgi:putative flippase GtrA
VTVEDYREFVRFCVAGGASALFSIILLSVFTDGLNLHYIPSFILSFIIVNTVAYATALIYTFQRINKPSPSGLARYYSASAFSLLLNSIFMFALVDILRLHHVIAATSLVFLNAPVNYALHKNFSFRKRN